MNIKDRMILEDFRKRLPDFEKLEKIVAVKLRNVIKKCNVLTTGIEHRIKTEASLEGKLYKSGDSYTDFYSLYDLLGARIICYFADGVDKIGASIEK